MLRSPTNGHTWCRILVRPKLVSLAASTGGESVQGRTHATISHAHLGHSQDTLARHFVADPSQSVESLRYGSAWYYVLSVALRTLN